MSTSELCWSSRRKTALLAVLLGGSLAVFAALPASARPTAGADPSKEEEQPRREKGHEEQRPPRGAAQQVPAPARVEPPHTVGVRPAPAPAAEQRFQGRPGPAPEQRVDARQDVRGGERGENRFVERAGDNRPADRGSDRGGDRGAVGAPRYGDRAVVGPPRGLVGPDSRIQSPSLASGGGRRAPPPARVVPRLEPGYRSYSWGGGQYYHQGGHWYRPYGGSYLIVSAPFGLFVPYLPDYYTTFWYGGSRYYMADDTYYLYDPARRGYIVTHSPYGDDVVYDDDEAGPSSSSERRDAELYVYPMRGQSERQQADDRYECHRWAVGQAHYDPTDQEYRADDRAQYDRALTACLTGRGYSVK